MRVHIVTQANRALYGSELEQMHRLRHHVFVDELGWRDLQSPDELEIDEFDDEHAVYLIACKNGEVHGSVRLLPTWRRCMITQQFSDFLGGAAAPTGPDVWEFTRWCPGTMRSPRNLIRARAALIVASLEFARSRHIKKYLTFCETKFVSQIAELGWHSTPLCMPRPFTEGMAIAVAWDVQPNMLADTRKLLRAPAPVSFEAPCPDEAVAWIAPAELEAAIFARPAQSSRALSVNAPAMGNA